LAFFGRLSSSSSVCHCSQLCPRPARDRPTTGPARQHDSTVMQSNYRPDFCPGLGPDLRSLEFGPSPVAPEAPPIVWGGGEAGELGVRTAILFRQSATIGGLGQSSGPDTNQEVTSGTKLPIALECISGGDVCPLGPGPKPPIVEGGWPRPPPLRFSGGSRRGIRAARFLRGSGSWAETRADTNRPRRCTLM
jgi:hypothetical protein